MKPGREFKIGAFVLVVLLISFFVINFLRGKDIFNREMIVTSTYDNIEGLVPSDPVYIKGYKAGSVASVDYDPETGNFDVSCSVLKKFRIPDDSKMTIYSRDIMGGKAIKIDPGTSGRFAEDGSFLEPSVQPDMIASLAGQLVPLLAKATATVENLDSVTTSLNLLLGSDNRSGIRNIIVKLDRTMTEAARISAAVGDRSEELGSFIDNISSFSSRLDSLADSADSTLSDINSVTSALGKSDIEGLVISFRNLIESIQDPDGTLGKLMSEGSIYDSLENLVSDADSLLKKIEENPKKYIRISVF